MAATEIETLEFTVTLSEDERAHLLSFLQQMLRDKHIEAHRTDAITYREYVQNQEELLQRLIDKLGRA